MKSPSYFVGDVRRLRVVSINMLEERCKSLSKHNIPKELQRTPKEALDFFRSIKYAIVLSNRGNVSEAARMSGGDYGEFSR